MARINTNQTGYTIPEMLIVISILAAITASFMVVFNNYLVTSSRTGKQLEMTNESQNILRIMTDEIRYGSGVRQLNLNPDPNAPPGGWNTSNSNFVIITTVPATDINNNFIIDPLTGNPYLNEYVYYKQSDHLYKRTLADPNAAGNTATTSCPEASATPTCPADRDLTENIDTINFVLYDQDNNVTTQAILARSIEINIAMSNKTFGSPITAENQIRMNLRNVY